LRNKTQACSFGLDFAVEEEIEARGKVGQQEKALRLESIVKTGQYKPEEHLFEGAQN
jgi:hypothetical protein